MHGRSTASASTGGVFGRSGTSTTSSPYTPSSWSYTGSSSIDSSSDFQTDNDYLIYDIEEHSFLQGRITGSDYIDLSGSSSLKTTRSPHGLRFHTAVNYRTGDPLVPEHVIIYGGFRSRGPTFAPTSGYTMPPHYPAINVTVNSTQAATSVGDFWRFVPPDGWEPICTYGRFQLSSDNSCPTADATAGARHSHAASLVDGSYLVITGGINDATGPMMDTQLAVVKDIDTGYSSPLKTEGFTPRFGHTSTTDGNGVVHLIGGYVCDTATLDCSAATDDHWTVTVTAKSASDVTRGFDAVWAVGNETGNVNGTIDALQARAYHSAVLVGDVIYVFGGEVSGDDEDGNFTRLPRGDMQVYSTVYQTWRNVYFNTFRPGVSPAPRSGHGMFYLPSDRDIFVTGGESGNGPTPNMYIYHTGPLVYSTVYNDQSGSAVDSVRPDYNDTYQLIGHFGGYDLRDSVCFAGPKLDRASAITRARDRYVPNPITTPVSRTSITCIAASHPPGGLRVTLAEIAPIKSALGTREAVLYGPTSSDLTYSDCLPGEGLNRQWSWVLDDDWWPERENGWSELACPVCPAGSISTGINTQCSSCLTGTFQGISGQTMCYQCPEGTYQPDVNGKGCIPCPLGTAQPLQGRSQCDICEDTVYSDKIGAKYCTSCPAGQSTMLLSTFIEDFPELYEEDKNLDLSGGGAWRAEMCQCGVGYYGENGVSCTECDDTMTCTIVGQQSPIPADGYWVAEAGSNIMFECNPKEACEYSENGGRICRTGHTGRMCANCKKDWYEVNGLCNPCPEQGGATRFVFAIIGGVLGLVGIVACSQVDPEKIKEASENVKDRPSPMASAPISITFLQITSSFATFKIPWPRVNLSFFSAFSIVNLNLQVTAPECAYPMDFYAKWRFQMFMPIVVTLLFVIVLLIIFAVKGYQAPKEERWNRIKDWFYTIAAGYILFLTLAYLFMAQIALTLFDCTLQGDGTYSLDADPYIYCRDKKWWAHVPFGIFGILFYVCGVPLAMFAMLVYIRKPWKGRKARPVQAHPLGANLAQKYETKLFWWELSVVLRKLGIVVVGMFFTSRPIIQTLVAIGILFTGLMITAIFRPYIERRHDFQEFALLSANFLTLFCGIVMLNPELEEEENAGFKESIGSAVNAILTISTLMMVACMALEIQEKFKEYKDKRRVNAMSEEEKAAAEAEQKARYAAVIGDDREAFVEAVRALPDAEFKFLLRDIDYIREFDTVTDSGEGSGGDGDGKVYDLDDDYDGSADGDAELVSVKGGGAKSVPSVVSSDHKDRAPPGAIAHSGSGSDSGSGSSYSGSESSSKAKGGKGKPATGASASAAKGGKANSSAVRATSNLVKDLEESVTAKPAQPAAPVTPAAIPKPSDGGRRNSVSSKSSKSSKDSSASESVKGGKKAGKSSSGSSSGSGSGSSTGSKSRV